ncbi:MAG: DEAD/DEAH box helicase [Fermentimonas sp.]|nr:DEAD/DEAH box helicase [Fermentimonas sp.]
MSEFKKLGVSPEIAQALTELGYEQPMPVQTEVIPQLLNQTRNIIALAQTGTGKTAAFGIPIIQKTVIKDLSPQTLILCPTRELCLQIAGDLADYSKYVEDIKILPVYGGSSIESQIRTLKRGVHIIVATPGRLLDLIKRKTVSLSNVHTVVLDEADEMLNMGFTEDLNEILSYVPENRSMLLFSATMPKEIQRITGKYMKDPMEITIGRKNEGAQNVRHIYYVVHAKDRYLALKRIVDYYPNIYGIIFCRTRKDTQEIADKLMQDGYDADSLHGDLSQAQRDLVMSKFRNHNLQLLVATDVAARGLDVDDVSHIINYSLPDDTESYTHRSGRTGRAGKAGTSISIIHTKERGKILQIEKQINKEFEKREIPKGDVICEKQLFNFVDKIEKVKVNEEEIERLLPSIFRKLEWLEKEDIIKRIVSLEFNRLIEYYQEAEEIYEPDDAYSRRGKGERGRQTNRNGNVSREPEKGYSRLFINVGKMDGINPAVLMGFINENVKGKVPIGKIDLMRNFSFFEVPEDVAPKVVSTFKGMHLEDRKLLVQFAQDAESNNSKKSFGRKKEESYGFGKNKKKKGKKQRY